MTTSAEQAAFLLDVCKLVPFATDLGFVVTGGELMRTPYQQEEYVRRGLSRTLDSYHLQKLAIDLNFLKYGLLVHTRQELLPVGKYWESLSPQNYWGGNFKGFPDLGHFERHMP